MIGESNSSVHQKNLADDEMSLSEDEIQESTLKEGDENSFHGHILETVGEKVDEIPVELSTRFLEHFSEQLYSSPNKAFEELVSNGWDAGARSVYIRASENYPSKDSTIYVMDDGFSMTANGLKDLWKVAHSPKESVEEFKGRRLIGRFGIGKLATYVLANHLTYICKGGDGVIRGVTMDFSELEGDSKNKLMRDLNLPLREISIKEVREALMVDEAGQALFNLIEQNFPEAEGQPEALSDEFGEDVEVEIEKSGCWTIAILSNLKPQGLKIQFGHLRRILSSSLPLGSKLRIFINDDRVLPSKINKGIMKEWKLSELNDIEFIYTDSSGQEYNAIARKNQSKGCLSIEGIGDIYGEFKLFDDKITGGKSDVHGASNGFHINILGRVINTDIAFGDKDFSHSVWARFRLTIRADGLNKFMAVSRESLFQSEEIFIFRAFLRKCFNVARNHYQEFMSSAWQDTGLAIVQAWGTLPLRALTEAIRGTKNDQGRIQELFDFDSDDIERDIDEWEKHVSEGAPSIIESVNFEDVDPDQRLSKYNISRRSLIINMAHPFASAHAETDEEKRLLRNIALLDLLTDAQAIELGIDPTIYREIQDYRDNTARLIAKLDRSSGTVIAKTLIEVADYENYKALETLVHEALDYLGFAIERKANRGEPEGVAKAYPTPDADSKLQNYSFTYDAKSAKSGKVPTGNVHAAGLNRHRRDFKADYALVVAPDYQQGALVDECRSNSVTPIRAADLGRLLVMTAEYGAISLTKLKEIFGFHDPDDVSSWVDVLEQDLSEKNRLDWELFFSSINEINITLYDPIASSHVAHVCNQIVRSAGGESQFTKRDVENLVRGFQVLAPDIIQLSAGNIVMSVHPQAFEKTIRKQFLSIKGQ